MSIELPLRDAGFLLPTWEDLVAFTGRARERGVPVHLDGARLWESQPFYDRPHADIAGLFDSVYVSFYKGLGGIAGAALAGHDLVAQARIWQARHGGNLFSMLPFDVARDGLPVWHPCDGVRRDITQRTPRAHDSGGIGVRVHPTSTAHQRVPA